MKQAIDDTGALAAGHADPGVLSAQIVWIVGVVEAHRAAEGRVLSTHAAQR